MQREITAFLLTLAWPLAAQDAALRDALAPVWGETDQAAFAKAADTVLERGASFDELHAALAAGPRYRTGLPKGWSDGTMRGKDGNERPYVLFVPERYDPARPHMLLVHLHGGVSRPQAPTHAQLRQTGWFWGEHAEEHAYLHLIPGGDGSAAWWTDIGAQNVLAQIARVRRDYHVDPDRIYATGFSDGASGSFYLALAHPTPFAAFVPLNGHIAVAGIGGLQVHLGNLRNRPLYVVNTDEDSLYPSAGIRPFVDAMQTLGIDLVWREIKGVGHQPSYLPEEREAIWKWIQAHPRSPHPARVAWQGTATAPARVHWLGGVALGDRGGEAPFADPVPAIEPARVRLGVHLDQAFTGPGLRIEKVVDDSPASAAGLRAGDVLLALGETKLADLRALRGALGQLDFGDAFTLSVRRGESTLTCEGRFEKAEPRLAFPRNAASGAIEIERDGNHFAVKCRGIARFELLLSPSCVDFAAPVRVSIDGHVVHDAPVEKDRRFLLEQAWRDKDPAQLYGARLVIEVPARDAKGGDRD